MIEASSNNEFRSNNDQLKDSSTLQKMFTDQIKIFKSAEESFAEIKFLFRQTKFGVNYYFGQLIKLKTSKHADMNQFERINKQKPKLRIVISQSEVMDFTKGQLLVARQLIFQQPDDMKDD